MSAMTHMRIGDRRWLLALACASIVSLGCGDDDKPGGGKPQTKAAKKKPGSAKKRRGKKKKGVELVIYRKIEQFASEEEKDTIRRPFSPRDTDPNEARDPFRSFVIQPAGSGLDTEVSVQPSEVCTEKNMVAPDPSSRDPRARQSFSLRDLHLAGIVLRGSRSYALFRDSGGYGHTVRRGDCLGKEKARVVKIGAGFVRLEMKAEPNPNNATQRPTKVERLLHPDELQLDEPQVEHDEDADDERDLRKRGQE